MLRRGGVVLRRGGVPAVRQQCASKGVCDADALWLQGEGVYVQNACKRAPHVAPLSHRAAHTELARARL